LTFLNITHFACAVLIEKEITRESQNSE
jgi:hypothetical protein